MIKWIKRIVIGLLTTIAILILLFVIIKPKPYYIINYAIGSQMQWFGYDKEGNEMIEKSIKKLRNFRASEYHLVSIQNTKNGNYNKAIEYLDKASELEPKEVDGYYGWLLLYYYRDYEKALFHLNRYDLFTPNFDDYVGDDNILYAKALCYKELGQYSKALELNIDLEPQIIALQYLAGIQLIEIADQVDEFDEIILAIQSLEQAKGISSGIGPNNEKLLKERSGNINEGLIFSRENNIDEIYCEVNSVSSLQLKEIINFSDENKIQVRLIPENKVIYSKNFTKEYFGTIPILKPKKLPFEMFETHLIKRCFDIDLLLSKETAEEIWERANEKLSGKNFSACGMLEQFKVKALCQIIATSSLTLAPANR